MTNAGKSENNTRVSLPPSAFRADSRVGRTLRDHRGPNWRQVGNKKDFVIGEAEPLVDPGLRDLGSQTNQAIHFPKPGLAKHRSGVISPVRPIEEAEFADDEELFIPELARVHLVFQGRHQKLMRLILCGVISTFPASSRARATISFTISSET